MLFTLGLGSSVSVVETILTCLKDQYIVLRKHSQWTALIVCTILCICGLSITTDVISSLIMYMLGDDTLLQIMKKLSNYNNKSSKYRFKML